MHNYWEGEHVRIRAVEPEDADFFYEWNQDSQMAQQLDYLWFPISKVRQKAWLEENAKEDPEKDDNHLFVVENKAGEPVGSISSHHCDRRVGSFRYAVAVKREHQRKGYAAEAVRLFLRYFFEELRYQKVTANVYSFNEPSIQLHEALGFRQEGRLRRTVYTHGQHYDELYYGMTVEEFHERWGNAQPPTDNPPGEAIQ